MNHLDELEAKLRREAQTWKPSPAVEARLLKELGHAHFRRVLQLTAAALAIAAIVLLAFLIPKPKPATKPQPAVAQVAKPEPAVQAAAIHPKRKPRRATPRPAAPEFIRIPYATPLEPGERAEIVRVELPVAAFAGTGLQIATADTGAKAQADLIVGEDGMARAIRLISILNNQ